MSATINPADYDRWRTAWADGDDPDCCYDCGAPICDVDLEECADGQMRCEGCADDFAADSEEEDE